MMHKGLQQHVGPTEINQMILRELNNPELAEQITALLDDPAVPLEWLLAHHGDELAAARDRLMMKLRVIR